MVVRPRPGVSLKEHCQLIPARLRVESVESNIGPRRYWPRDRPDDRAGGAIRRYACEEPAELPAGDCPTANGRQLRTGRSLQFPHFHLVATATHHACQAVCRIHKIRLAAPAFSDGICG